MKYVSDIIPWRLTNISLRPFKGFYSFNPSIHFDGEKWRCVMRNCDYHAKGGEYAVKNGRIITRNALVTFNPSTWEPSSLVEMREIDSLQRYPTSEWGYEDMRLFIAGGKLRGVATTAQLRPEPQQEIVLVDFDEDSNICNAEPVRGSWSNYAQKNWTPYDGTTETRLVYSIDQGIVLLPENDLSDYVPDIIQESKIEATETHRPHSRGGVDTIVFSKPRSNVGIPKKTGYDWSPTKGLRGGSQVIRVGDLWLGIGHEMKFQGGKKLYWHRFYLLSEAGKKIAESDNFKLSDFGIEFAAGIARDGENVVISYGTEDRDSWLGTTKLNAILEMIKPCS